MNITFLAIVGDKIPKKLWYAKNYVASFSYKMSILDTFEIELWAKGWKKIHPVNVINKLKENIISIHFIHIIQIYIRHKFQTKLTVSAIK